MTALEELLGLPERKDNPYLKEWKDKGGRVIGTTCVYVPEEIICAAGALPYRMEARGCTKTGLADVYYHRFNCTFPRSLLQAGLAGEYGFLDGFCVLNGCEQIRRVYEVWERYVKTGYQFLLTVPHDLNDNGFRWYVEELVNFKESLMQSFAVRCSVQELRNAIRTYNESRRLVQELYDLRKTDKVRISGADATKILLAAFIMPRERYNSLLREALEEIRTRKVNTDYRARLMIGGSACDDPQIMHLIEGQGGLVVSDTLCFGSRSFGELIEEDGDPLEALARHYYNRNPCPRMLTLLKDRVRYTEKAAKEANADGVVLQRIVFCDGHGTDATLIADELEEKGIPTLILEREYSITDVGRFKTRIEAFLERIGRA